MLSEAELILVRPAKALAVGAYNAVKRAILLYFMAKAMVLFL
jgi:hypothetical protein